MIPIPRVELDSETKQKETVQSARNVPVSHSIPDVNRFKGRFFKNTLDHLIRHIWDPF